MAHSSACSFCWHFSSVPEIPKWTGGGGVYIHVVYGVVKVRYLTYLGKEGKKGGEGSFSTNQLP